MAYKWTTPYEWLVEASKEWGSNRVHQEFMSLAECVDSDTLQAQFEELMRADGYSEEEE